MGEMNTGLCVFRGDAKESYLESAPVLFRTEPAGLASVSDAELARRL